MTIDPANAGGAGLIDRVKNILLTPKAEFERIDAETADVQKIYVGYVAPLLAVAALCTFIGTSLIGVSALGYSYKVPMVAGLVGAVLRVIMGLVGVYIMAFITNALAPNFGSQANIGKARRMARPQASWPACSPFFHRSPYSASSVFTRSIFGMSASAN